jgi:predicted permease
MMVRSCFVGSNMSDFTGITPIIGRPFGPEDTQADAPRVVLISSKLWASALDSDPGIIGRTLVINGLLRTVVGVMPEDFDGPTPESGVQIWLPMSFETMAAEIGWRNYVSFLASIKDGIPPDMAKERMVDLSRQIYEAYPDDNDFVNSARLLFINGDLFPEHTRDMFLALFICALLIMFMSCGIASGLMTARYSARTQEFAIRSALGASRGGLVSQMVFEFLLVSASATVLGLLLDQWIANSFLSSYMDQFGLPAYLMKQPTWPMYLFVIGVLVVVTLASTVLPALRASRTDVASILRESSRTGSSLRVTRMSKFLIVWQVASAGSILCGCALMGNVIHKFSTQNNYYDPRTYVCADISMNAHDHKDLDVRLDRMQRIMDAFENYPEIEEYGISNEFGYYGYTQTIQIEGEPIDDVMQRPRAAMRIVSPGYFAATKVPLLLGRDFERTDMVNNLRVAVVTDAFANRHFGTLDVVGKRIFRGNDTQPLTIVGVVPDLFASDPARRREVGYFVPYNVARWQDVRIFAKPRATGTDMERIMREIVRDVDDKLCVSNILPISEYRRLFGGGLYLNFLFSFFVAFASGALLMSAAGLYGIISFSVNSRKRDMGIRLALGASPQGVVLSVARSGIANTIVGLCFAVVGTLGIRQIVVTDIASAISSVDSVLLYVLSAVILLSVTAFAIFIPAVKGAMAEPADALRSE